MSQPLHIRIQWDNGPDGFANWVIKSPAANDRDEVREGLRQAGKKMMDELGYEAEYTVRAETMPPQDLLLDLAIFCQALCSVYRGRKASEWFEPLFIQGLVDMFKDRCAGLFFDFTEDIVDVVFDASLIVEVDLKSEEELEVDQ